MRGRGRLDDLPNEGCALAHCRGAVTVRELGPEKLNESLNEWRDSRAGDKRGNDFTANRGSGQVETDKLARREFVGDQGLDLQRITRVALDEPHDGIVISGLDHRARRHSGCAKLALE